MAKKYIDADLLKKEVEKRMYICGGIFERDSDTYYQGKAVAYQETLPLINSLQQEQSCDTCTNDKGCVICKDGELWEGKEQRQVDLEEEIKRYLQEEHDRDTTVRDVARHFYILGLKNNIPVTQITLADLAKEGEPVSKDLEKEYEEYVDKDPVFGKLINHFAGITVARHFANWQKEQMLKEAVEGYVNYYEDGGGILMAEAQVGCPYHNGDKVKIVIIPDKEE